MRDMCPEALSVKNCKILVLRVMFSPPDLRGELVQSVRCCIRYTPSLTHRPHSKPLPTKTCCIPPHPSPSPLILICLVAVCLNIGYIGRPTQTRLCRRRIVRSSWRTSVPTNIFDQLFGRDAVVNRNTADLLLGLLLHQHPLVVR